MTVVTSSGDDRHPRHHGSNHAYRCGGGAAVGHGHDHHRRLLQAGIWHQSNGRAEPLSRSWNRLYLNAVFERGDLAFSIKPWYRIPEDEEDDDNPDIERYLGYGELGAAYKWRGNTFSMMFRNNLRTSGNKGAIELGWSFPLYRKLKGYVQYFNGYGQSILDYNDAANTIGVGLALTDFL